jgi:hypothetical protein
MGLPRIWHCNNEADDGDIECNITAPEIVEQEVQVHLQDGEFEDIPEEEWAKLIAVT